VCGVPHEPRQALGFEHPRYALHRLARETHAPRDLRHRARFAPGRAQYLPARRRLCERPRELDPVSLKAAMEAKHRQDELGQLLGGRRALRHTLPSPRPPSSR